MALEVEAPILSALSARSPHWRRWVHFVDTKIAVESLPTADLAVTLLRNYLKAERLSGVQFLRSVREHFEIAKWKNSGHSDGPLPGQGWVKISRDPQEWFGHDVVIGVGNASQRRKFSVEAHEIAHLFHAILAERMVMSPIAKAKQKEETERFCWEFALSVFCPDKEQKTWNASSIAQLLSPSERELVARLEPDGLHRLSYWHIRALARRNNISMRMVIVALDRHAFLDEVCYGIGIFKRMPNPATSSELALRVHQRACPGWGYLVKNQRVEKQGFDMADFVYSSGGHQKTVVYKERLRLRFARQRGAVKWPVKTVDTSCAYTPVDVASEGRYLLAIWLWNRA